MGKYLTAKAGNSIYYQADLIEKPKATVLINHGFAEHLARYDHVAYKLNKSGYNVYRYDLRGHGKSGEERGHINSYREFIDDCQEMINLIKSNGQEEIFMLGHSMGGLITFIYGFEFPDSLLGQIFSGAAVGDLPSASGFNANLLLFGNTFFKKLMIKNPVSDDINSDIEVVKRYKEDPLVLKEATMNFYLEFTVKAVNYAKENMKKYKYPCFIAHGEKDKIVPKEISYNLYNAISSSDKEIKIYDDLYHEILNEKPKDQILDDMVFWMDKRI